MSTLPALIMTEESSQISLNLLLRENLQLSQVELASYLRLPVQVDYVSILQSCRKNMLTCDFTMLSHRIHNDCSFKKALTPCLQLQVPIQPGSRAP
jgi:hypothetical protein